MRIYFRDIMLPKKAAKRLKSHFTSSEVYGVSLTLSKAKEITASMLGYTGWFDLEQTIKKGEHLPSQLDEDVLPSERLARIEYQTDKLAQFFPDIGPELKQIVIKIRVSSGMRKTKSYEGNTSDVLDKTLWLTPSPEFYRQFATGIRDSLLERMRGEHVSDDDIEFRKHCWEVGYCVKYDGNHPHAPLVPVLNDLRSFPSVDEQKLSNDLLGQLDWYMQITCREYFRSLEQALEGGFEFKSYNHPNFEQYSAEFIHHCLGNSFNDINWQAQNILRAAFPMFYVRAIGISLNTRMWQSSDARRVRQ